MDIPTRESSGILALIVGDDPLPLSIWTGRSCPAAAEERFPRTFPDSTLGIISLDLIFFEALSLHHHNTTFNNHHIAQTPCAGDTCNWYVCISHYHHHLPICVMIITLMSSFPYQFAHEEIVLVRLSQGGCILASTSA